ncbi:MAG TPA: hypothetical protein VKH35_00185 [Thermoanaerobaculia bacterium]|nr:hypothetical protein [Thermoanaerobaculia bacterium]
MRKCFLFVTAGLLTAASAFAVAPEFWRVRSAVDFLAGDIDGFAVTSRGELRPGPAMTRIASFNDPFVFSQTTAPNGDRFFGTGNDGKVYRLRGSDLKLVYMAPESEIYALAFRDGALYVGTSPNGKVYRVDPNDGKASTYFDPKQAYIWAMQFLPNGDLAVGTGVEGKLFRVDSKGESKVLLDSTEAHIRSLAVRKDGTLLAGGSAQGRIYEIRPDGSTHALYDSSLNEISAIYIDQDGTGWAAGVSNVSPSAAPAKSQPQKPAAQQPSSSQSSSASADQQKKDETPSGTAEVTFSFDNRSSGTNPQAGATELYRIDPDGFVEVVWKFEHEMIYGISAAPGGGVLLSTGPQGRIYRFRDGEIALLASVPDKQVVSVSTTGAETLITTTNSGAVYRMENAFSPKAEFRSSVKDAERFSHFGHFQIDGQEVGDGHVAVAFRSGNTSTPDATWSAWSAPVAASAGEAQVPPGRYLQWKLTMPKPAAAISVNEVTVGYVNRNVAPVIDSVAVQDPAVVYITGGYPASPQVVEATNPDQYGIFTSLETHRERTEPGKKVFRRGFRTVMWRAHDDNGDKLEYEINFRRVGSDRWLRLRENLDETSMNFDTSQLPDGRYELRLVAGDGLDNPGTPLTDTKEGIDFLVDNTPPSITSKTEGDAVLVRVTDKLSPIGKVEYSLDAERWIPLTPVDGIADSPDETYRLERKAIAGKFVIVRATDAFYNVATESVGLNP